MTRNEFRTLADERALDAEALLAAGRWSGAYYLAGYAVECALKACIAKLTNQDDFPDKERAIKSYTHKIDTLVEAARLVGQRDTDSSADPILAGNWLTIRRWDEQSRYKMWTESEARELLNAVTDTAHGVLPWIRVRW